VIEAESGDHVEANARTQKRSRRWRGVALLLVLAAIAVTVANSIELTIAHEAEVRSRPDPPFGEWVTYSGIEIVRVGLNGIGLGVAVALPALVLVVLLARRVDVSASRVAAVTLLTMILVGINGGRIQYAIFEWLGVTQPVPAGSNSALVTPAVEETLKLLAVAIVMLSGVPRSGARTGLVLGLAAGIGVTIVEGGLYSQLGFIERGEAPYAETLATRFVFFGLNLHSTTTALAGAALGAWLVPPIRARRIWIVAAGVAGAAAIHGVWNLFGSALATRVIVAMWPEAVPPIAPTSILAAATIASVLFLFVPWLVLGGIWKRAGAANATGTIDRDADGAAVDGVTA